MVVVLLMGCNMAQDNPLIGRWKSNKTETIKEMQNCGEYTEHQIALITLKITLGELILEKYSIDYTKQNRKLEN
jgi:hypothetical protein